jgi:DNA-binding XRE family transcriptional regulator
MRKPAYPILAQLMAKHGLTRKNISEIVGLSYRHTIRKLNKDKTSRGIVALFDIVEAGRIVKYFKDLGEEVTIDGIFLS